MTAAVKLTANGAGRGTIFIDGVDMTKNLRAVETKVRAGTATEVTLEMVVPTIESLELTETSIVINGTEMPPSVEAALFSYLCKKNGIHSVEVTHMSSESSEHAPIA